jgi:hypothetical protein
MEIEFGVTVVDKNRARLGNVDYIVRDTWSGDIRKFVVRQKDLGNELFLSPDDVTETTDKQITLNSSLKELSQRQTEEGNSER